MTIKVWERARWVTLSNVIECRMTVDGYRIRYLTTDGRDVEIARRFNQVSFVA